MQVQPRGKRLGSVRLADGLSNGRAHVKRSAGNGEKRERLRFGRRIWLGLVRARPRERSAARGGAFCLATACRDRISNLPALVSGQAAAAATAAFVRRRFRRRRSPLGASTSSIERERTAQIGKRWPCDGSRSASHLARLGLHPVFFARSGGVRDRASPGHHVRVQGIASPERRMQIVCLLTNLPTRAK